MQELIDVIRTAIAADANNEQKAAGVQACNTIASALGTTPGTPLVLPSMPPRSPLAGVSFEQVLDLAIAKLTSIANAHETAPALPAAPTTLAPASGLRIPAPIAVSQITRPTAIRPPAVKVARPATAPRPGTTTRPTRPPTTGINPSFKPARKS